MIGVGFLCHSLPCQLLGFFACLIIFFCLLSPVLFLSSHHACSIARVPSLCKQLQMQEHSISRTGCFSIPNQLLVVEEGQGIKLTQLCPFLFFQSANAPPTHPQTFAEVSTGRLNRYSSLKKTLRWRINVSSHTDCALEGMLSRVRSTDHVY